MPSSLDSLTGTLTLDTRFSHLYRPLLRNLTIIVVLTIVAAAAALMYFDERLVRSLSEDLIEMNAQGTREQLVRVFQVADRALRIAQPQIEHIDIGSSESSAELFNLLEPFLTGIHLLDSINVADSSGSEFVLIKKSKGILTRQIDGNTPGVARWRRFVGGEVVESWERQTEVSPLDRPWYQGALERESGGHFWTDPYTFLTTKEPGISVASRHPRVEREGEYVVALNMSLMEISEYTTSNRPSDHGMHTVFTDDGKAIGLPPDPRYADRNRLLAAVLSPLAELGVAPVDDALEAWAARGRKALIFRYTTGGSPWWAGFTATEGRRLWSAVLIPESDFLGTLAQQRNLALAAIGLLSLLICGAVLAVSMRSIRRQVKQAVDEAEQRYGQYQLKHKIGEGGNGTVYQAQHCLLRRPTAIKLMNPDFMRSPSCRERFEHEVQITSSLSHPNTIAIYDYGQTPEGKLFYAMELLDGGTLEQLVSCSGPLPAGRVIHLLEQMAGSLSEAHSKGLIHRDVKPSNAIVCERGGIFDVVKVLDFGLVKEIEDSDANVTRADVLVGTPHYMAPEVIRGPGGGPQSDLYALGAVGYFLLTGYSVFEGASAVEICAKHLNEAPVPPSQRVGLDIPEDLEAIILWCLEKDPAARPADAQSLQERLMSCRDAGAWSQQDARAWWQAYRATFVGGASAEDATPMSNTEILVDLDERLGSAGSGSA